jgi:putative aldouronate transport system permease protein
MSKGYSIFPRLFSLDAYAYIFSGSSTKIFHSYLISIFVTVAGTTCSVLITALYAYPLSRQDFPGRKFLSFFIILPMLFNGGIVPSYMMWTQIFHIKNTFLALLLPNLLMNTFYVIIMRTSFQANIAKDLIEAGSIDGATETRIFFSIVMPLSKPILATVGFMVGLGYWNDWLNGLYYVSDNNYYGIQNILNKMLTDAQFLASSEGNKYTQVASIQIPSLGIRMAVAVFGILPVLIAFPFVQKYFVKGITLGAVKG